VGHLADRLAGGGIDGLEGPAAGALDALAADQQSVGSVDELPCALGEGF